jgi:hypothetical protein
MVPEPIVLEPFIFPFFFATSRHELRRAVVSAAAASSSFSFTHQNININSLVPTAVVANLFWRSYEGDTIVAVSFEEKNA